MNIYVIATDRDGSNLTRIGMMLHKQIIVCNSLQEAMRVSCALKMRGQRFSAIQTTQTEPVLNPGVYTCTRTEAGAWLGGR